MLNKKITIMLLLYAIVNNSNHSCDCKKINNYENKIDQSFFKNETEENKIIDLVREQLYQYKKYQQMLEENVFQNLSQKKLVQSIEN